MLPLRKFHKNSNIYFSLSSYIQADLILSIEEEEFFTFHLRGNQTNAPVELPSGEWTFYGLYWENRTAYCTVKTEVTLDAPTQRVDLVFDQDTCFHSLIANKNFTSQQRINE